MENINLHSLYKVFFLLMLSATFGCVQTGKEVELSILCNKLGEKPSDQLPKNIKHIISNLQSKKCVSSDEALFVHAQLVTLKTAGNIRKLDAPQSAQEKFFNTHSAKKLLQYIDTATIGSAFATSAKFDSTVISKTINSYDMVFIFNESPVKILVKNISTKSTNDLDTLLKDILSSICGKNVKKMLIIYDVFESVVEEIQNANEEILHETENARQGKAKEVIEKYENKIVDNPLAMYELTKTIIIDGDHHEAFSLLNKAVVLAIQQGKSVELYSRMGEDLKKDAKISNPRDRTIWRLANGHPKDWQPIINALINKDPNDLKKETHHHHDD